MKKLFLAFAAVAVLFAACSKEIPTKQDTNITENTSTMVYTLSASMPKTRATVNESTGKFEWASTDEIAVYDNEQSKYQIFTTTGSGETVTFTFTATDGLAHDFTSSAAYYPASRLNPGHTDVNMPVALASAGDVPMTATNDAGSLAFNYQSAVVKLTVNNVPSFAKSVEFVNDGNSYAAEISHSINENITFYLAVAGSSNASSSIILYDTSDNEIINISFALKGGAPVNGALIPLTTTVGPVLLIQNNAKAEMENAGKSWDVITSTNGDICFYSKKDATEYCSWSSSNTNLNSISINTTPYQYFVYPKGAAGQTVRVELCNKDGGSGYPKFATTLTLAQGEQTYTFSYGEGLKKAGEKFFYAVDQDGGEGTCVYAWTGSTEHYGSFSTNNGGVGLTTMWDNGRTIRMYDFTVLSTSSNYIFMKGGLTGKNDSDKLTGNIQVTSTDVSNGWIVYGYWHNGGGSGAYKRDSWNTYLADDVWK